METKPSHDTNREISNESNKDAMGQSSIRWNEQHSEGAESSEVSIDADGADAARARGKNIP